MGIAGLEGVEGPGDELEPSARAIALGLLEPAADARPWWPGTTPVNCE